MSLVRKNVRLSSVYAARGLERIGFVLVCVNLAELLYDVYVK